MKRLISSVALLTILGACAQEAEAPAAATMESYVGTWNLTLNDGTILVSTNNADGTFTDMQADGTEMPGTWTFGETQSCWTYTGESENCYTISTDDATGTLTMTATDGSMTTATRVVADAVAPAAEAPTDAG